MTATLEFLGTVVAKRLPPDDWVNLNNFRRPHRPKPYRLPPGVGHQFRDRMADLVPQLREALAGALGSEDYLDRVRVERDKVQAEARGVQREDRGSRPARRRHGDRPLDRRGDRRVRGIRRVGQVADPMRVDIVESLGRFRPPPPESEGEEAVPAEAPEGYYAVNLFVDHADDEHPSVVLKPNPTYENIFGRMGCRQLEGALDKDFSLIQSGSIHRANGGVLVLRADAIARNMVAWEVLKSALRDCEVAVEERERAGALPVAGAPRAKPVPLDLKVIVAGAPH